MSRNPLTCPHNLTENDPDTGEHYCLDCGDVLNLDEEELDY